MGNYTGLATNADLDNLGTNWADKIPFFGVIRQDTYDSGWYFIGGAHQHYGFDGTITRPGQDIQLTYPTVSKVGSITAVGDEVFTSQGLMFGASVGTSSLGLYAYAKYEASIDFQTGAVTDQPYWITQLNKDTTTGVHEIWHSAPTLDVDLQVTISDTPNPSILKINKTDSGHFNFEVWELSGGTWSLVLDPVCTISISGGYAPLNMRDLYSTTGNIWITGYMWK